MNTWGISAEIWKLQESNGNHRNIKIYLVLEMGNSFNELISRLNTAKESISEIEDRSREMILTKTEGEKEWE